MNKYSFFVYTGIYNENYINNFNKIIVFVDFTGGERGMLISCFKLNSAFN